MKGWLQLREWIAVPILLFFLGRSIVDWTMNLLGGLGLHYILYSPWTLGRPAVFSMASGFIVGALTVWLGRKDRFLKRLLFYSSIVLSVFVGTLVVVCKEYLRHRRHPFTAMFSEASLWILPISFWVPLIYRRLLAHPNSPKTNISST